MGRMEKGRRVEMVPDTRRGRLIFDEVPEIEQASRSSGRSESLTGSRSGVR